MKIERYIGGETVATCLHVIAKELKEIAFCFFFEDYRPEYDSAIVEKYPDVFYLEDMEVLAVKDSAQCKLSLETYLEIAKNHPTGVVEIVCPANKTNLLSNERTDILNYQVNDWYWD